MEGTGCNPEEQGRETGGGRGGETKPWPPHRLSVLSSGGCTTPFLVCKGTSLFRHPCEDAGAVYMHTRKSREVEVR